MSVSVVIPVYNGAQVLPKTVPAVLAMAGIDEWVWVDDGSTDESHALLTNLLSYEPRARVIRQPGNTGRSAARNRGIQETTGKALVFLDCDVQPPPHAALALAGALQNDAVASIARIRPVLGERRDPYAVYLSRYPRGPSTTGSVPWRFFLAGACAVSRRVLAEAGGFDESVPYGEDFALACRLCHSHPDGLRLCDVTLDLFGVGDLSTALVNVRQFGASMPQIEAACPGALRLAGLGGAVESRALRALASVPVPRLAAPVLRRLPPTMQARAVRYLLGHALLAAIHGA